MTSQTLVLGYNAAMPSVIENTTTLGLSVATVDALKANGKAALNIIHDTSLKPMAGEITLMKKQKFKTLVSGQLTTVPVLVVKAQFAKKQKTAEGYLILLDNRNNSLLLEYSLAFSGEKAPRTERIVVVEPGAQERSAMEQALQTIRSYTTRGIHFDFDKATIQPDSRGLIEEIATTLKNNPLWTLQITGHTDAIGKPSYNVKLSQKRAEMIKAAIAALGVSPARLTTSGKGAEEPVAGNDTLEGRAQNRRVVLARTDR